MKNKPLTFPTYLQYDAFLEKSVRSIPSDRRSFFLSWCLQRIRKQYRSDYLPLLSKDIAKNLDDMVDLTLKGLDHPGELSKNQPSVLSLLKKIDAQMLAIDWQPDCSAAHAVDSILDLIESFWSDLSEIESEKLKFAGTQLFNLLDQRLSEKYGLDTREDHVLMTHPETLAEITAMQKMIESLA